MIAIVTGASSGIGSAVCTLLVKKGYTVYGLSRRKTAPEGVIGMAVDISDENAVNDAVKYIAEKEGRIDLLVNNAGMGISGPIEFTSTEDAQRIMAVNFFGHFYCARAVLPYMRGQSAGRIIFTSSVAAPIAIPYQGFYSAGKAALSALALSLLNEVREFGIKVAVVMPGDAHTGFTDARKKQSAGDDIYTHNASAVASMEKDERGGMSSEQVAETIIRAATAAKPKALYTVGTKYKFMLGLFNLLPTSLSYRIVGKMY